MIDQNDLAAASKVNQANIGRSMWPIVISPAMVEFNLNSPVEVPINPCDSIWLPKFYDPAIFNNSEFYDLVAEDYLSGPVNPCTPLIGSLFSQGGCNTFPIIDASNQVDQIWGPTIALRFNSMSNPWTIWTLNNFLMLSENVSAGSPYVGIGAMDSMRSISGQITRLWVKYFAWGNVYNTNAPATSTGATMVLMSSLGFNAKISSQTNSTFNLLAADAGGADWGIQTSNDSFSVGSFITPALNTLERIQLESTGVLGSGVRPASNVVAKLRNI